MIILSISALVALLHQIPSVFTENKAFTSNALKI